MWNILKKKWQSVCIGTTSGYLLILKTLQRFSHRVALFAHINPVLSQGHVQIMSITNHIVSSGLCFVAKKN